MQNKLNRFFVASAGAILAITATAKMISAFGSVRILSNPDPIFGISVRELLFMVASLELVVAVVCFRSNRVGLQAQLILWLSAMFVVYRVGLILLGQHSGCACLGTVTEVINVSQESADTVMKGILAYLLIGSSAILFWLRKSSTPKKELEIGPFGALQ